MRCGRLSLEPHCVRTGSPRVRRGCSQQRESEELCVVVCVLRLVPSDAACLLTAFAPRVAAMRKPLLPRRLTNSDFLGARSAPPAFSVCPLVSQEKWCPLSLTLASGHSTSLAYSAARAQPVASLEDGLGYGPLTRRKKRRALRCGSSHVLLRRVSVSLTCLSLPIAGRPSRIRRLHHRPGGDHCAPDWRRCGGRPRPLPRGEQCRQCVDPRRHQRCGRRRATAR